MAKDLDEALEYLLEEEGGWSNHPLDRGGATMYGITQRTYNAWRDKKKRKRQTVRSITKQEAKELYQKEYWEAASCDKLPWPISYLTFDAAVNSGVSRAVKWTQTGLRVQADGIVGSATVAKASSVLDEGDGRAILDIVDQRVSFLANLIRSKESQQAFLLGWWRRTLRILARSLLTNLEDED
jgi:lysozyme family protein